MDRCWTEHRFWTKPTGSMMVPWCSTALEKSGFVAVGQNWWHESCVFSSKVFYCFILCRLGWQNARVFHSNKPASSTLQLWNWDDTRCSLDCFPFCANSQVGNPLSQVSRIILVGHCIAQHLHIRIWVIKSTLVDWLWLVIVIVISWKFYWLISGKMLSWDHDEP